MRLLLDTHTLLWALVEPANLSPRATALIRDMQNLVLVSAASAWEIATKYRLGKLPHAAGLVEGYASHLATLRADELPIRSSHALVAGNFRLQHRDPFDRMLAAQALVEGIPLVTNDAVFRDFSGLKTVW